MQATELPSGLQSIIFELEKRYPYFKKMDIYGAVSDALKKVHSLLRPFTVKELEEIKKIANNDLSLSV